MSTLSDLMRQLRAAADDDYATIAKNVGQSKQFVYDLRDGRARYAYRDGRRLPVDEDPRYRKLAEYFENCGLSAEEFLTACRAAQSEVGGERAMADWSDAVLRQRASGGFEQVRIRVLAAALEEGLDGGGSVQGLGGGEDSEPPESSQLLQLLLDTCPVTVDSRERRRRIVAVLDAYSRGCPRSGT